MPPGTLPAMFSLISLSTLLTPTSASLVAGAKSSSSSLMCYSERSGTKMQNCHSSFGFKTCFTKYNYKNEVILRGCSSRRKMFHVECESHLSGVRNEQICYCSYDLCNELSSGAVVDSLPSNQMLLLCTFLMNYFCCRVF